MNMHKPFLLASLLASVLAGTALLADEKNKGSAPEEYILTAAQASGGQRIMTKENEPAVLFPPSDPVKTQIDWKIERPVPPGLWQIDLDIFEPTGNFCAGRTCYLYRGKRLQTGKVGSLSHAPSEREIYQIRRLLQRSAFDRDLSLQEWPAQQKHCRRGCRQNCAGENRTDGKPADGTARPHP